MEKTTTKEKVVAGDGGVAIKVVKNLEKGTLGTFVGLLRNKMGDNWRNWVGNNIQLDFVQSKYALGVGICAERSGKRVKIHERLGEV